jgi:acetoacetyl-CoA synthetase
MAKGIHEVMTPGVKEGDLMWTPSQAFQETSEMKRYMTWLEKNKGLTFKDYNSLWEWSVKDIDGFWRSQVDFFGVHLGGSYSKVLSTLKMPGAKWFEGATVNYAEHLLKYRDSKYPAIIAYSEVTPTKEISWKELLAKIGAVAESLRKAGVKKGDRVAGYLPNVPEAAIAFIATASLGAVWSCTSPDFGSSSVVERFSQIEPKVLFAVDGYKYGGKAFDRLGVVAELRKALPTVKTLVLLPYLNKDSKMEGAVYWNDFASGDHPIKPEMVPFDHPLWILFSSGTTGLPKPIVQSQGGIILEHLKSLALHFDLKPGGRFMWWTTTGWMMWNYLVGGLLLGGTIVTYDGSPGYPGPGRLWEMVREAKIGILGGGAAYFSSCIKAGIDPMKDGGLENLFAIGSTGSPLPPEAFEWLYNHVKKDLWVASFCGGTDVCTGFLGGSPLLPVRAGEIQCRSLGAKATTFDDDGKEIVNKVGELVLTAPLPSMPIYFWNDPKGERYHGSYFDVFPGVWRHGDWVRITPEGGCVIAGRSDATLKRKGVRMGTAEIYAVVESMPEITDSLVVGVDLPDGDYFMPLFVVIKDNAPLTDDLKKKITQKVKTELSSRHVPDDVIQVPALPKTLSGKKLEVPLRKILMGISTESAMNPGSVNDPALVHRIVQIVREKVPLERKT